MSTMTSFFRTFGFKGEYNGASCTRKLSGNRIARISLSDENGRTLSTQGHYISLKVEIVDVTTGPIDRQMFVFDDLIKLDEYLINARALLGTIAELNSFDAGWLVFLKHVVTRTRGSSQFDGVNARHRGRDR